MPAIHTRYFRFKDQWECLILERLTPRDEADQPIGAFKGRSEGIAMSELEAYPDYVRAKEDFTGGMIHEIFEVVTPWENLVGGHSLRVRRIGGRFRQKKDEEEKEQDRWVLIPLSIAEPSLPPVWIAGPVAV